MRSLILIVTLGCAMALPSLCRAQADASGPSRKADEDSACGTGEKETNFSQKTDKKAHPMGEQAADKALIYVLRPTMLGYAIQTKLAVDGQWMGVNRGDSYFFFSLAPGQHYFCSRAENHSLLALKVEAGETYYLQQEIRMGVMKAQNELTVMNDYKAKEKLEKLHLSTWEVK
jgi:hypothetical protein